MSALSWADLPRGAVVVTDVPALAVRAQRMGRKHVFVGEGGQARDAAELARDWSRKTHRAGSVLVQARDAELAEVARKCAARAATNSNTGITRSRAWVENLVANLHRVARNPPAQALSGAYTGVPCFVVGAGPSLSKNASWANLGAARGIVVTVNAGSRCVHGQCILTVEANDLSHKLEPRDSLKLYSLSSPPAVFGYGSGPTLPIYTGEVSAPIERLLGWPRVPTSVSGTTTAVSLAYQWGCDPIVLVGQDLGFTGGRVYADGTGHEDDTVADDGTYRWGVASMGAARNAPLPPRVSELSRVDGWHDGETVLGDLGHYAIAHWLTGFAEHTDGTVRTINATEGGRYIPGWGRMRLEDVVSAFPERRITPADMERDAGEPAVTPKALREWLTHRAPDELLEAYTHGAVILHMERHRYRPPKRLRFLEALAVRRCAVELEALVAAHRADLETLCLTSPPLPI